MAFPRVNQVEQMHCRLLNLCMTLWIPLGMNVGQTIFVDALIRGICIVAKGEMALGP